MSKAAPWMAFALAGEYARVSRAFDCPPSQMRECRLPSCRTYTRHRKGFCCAEHYRQYKTEEEHVSDD